MVFLQEIRTPVANALFLFLNLFDTEYFPLVILPIAWVLWQTRWGVSLVYLFTASAWLNSALKHLFELPRPCTHPEIMCLVPLKSFSFPSGGAQTAMLFGGLLFLSTSSKLWKSIALVYFLLISFSRIYLSVHYPTDILGGWIAGALLLIIYFKSKQPLETWFMSLSIQRGFCYSFIAPWCLFPLYPTQAALFPIATASAMALGLYFIRKQQLYLAPYPSLRSASLRIAIVFAGTLAIYLPAQLFPYFWVHSLLEPTLILLWISAGVRTLLRHYESKQAK